MFSAQREYLVSYHSAVFNVDHGRRFESTKRLIRFMEMFPANNMECGQDVGLLTV
jgi:hypothetical protein